MSIKPHLKQWTSVVCILLFAGVVAADCGKCGADAEKRKCCTKKGSCCKTGEKKASCSADCIKPCCAKSCDKKACAPGCTKPCCAKSCDKKACPADCPKACCADKAIAVNSEAPDFTLTDIHGKTVKLSEFDDKIVVLEWTNYDCPFVKAHYAPEKKTTSKLAEKYKDKDVDWLVINSTHYTTAEKTQAWAKKVGLKQTVLIDTDGKVGKLYHAKTTPHLYVINKDGKVVYQGALDNAPLGKTPNGEDYVNYVDKAIGELLEGEDISTPKTKPYGCSVKYAKQEKAAG